MGISLGQYETIKTAAKYYNASGMRTTSLLVQTEAVMESVFGTVELAAG